MFTVIIPLYNKARSISSTIESVLRQTFTQFEIIVVNDGSTDESLSIVECFKDARIRIINQANGGVSRARNRGIREARFKWIAFLDGDDFWFESHLETIYNLIQKFPENLIFCSSYRKSNENSRCEDLGFRIIPDYFSEAVLRHFLWTSVVVVNKDVLDRVGLFDERLSLGEDLELWSRIGRMFPIIKSNRVTAIYRISAENRSNLNYSYNKSYISKLDFKNKSKSERIYLKKLIIRKVKTLLIEGKLLVCLRLIVKYNLKIII